jgi:predicted nucleotidyltransferase
MEEDSEAVPEVGASAVLGAATSEAEARAAIGEGIPGASLEQELSELIQRIKRAFGDRFVSAILYGSAAMGDWHERNSDLNVLCVLSRLSPKELGASEPIFRWWRGRGNPPPLLMTLEEVRKSADCFPMEFHDMQEHRRVLYGADLIEHLDIDRSFYRAQVEHELRAKQIRLRQKAAEVLSNRDRLLKLLTDSISTFCVLGRHALILSGSEPRWKKREILAALEQVMDAKLEGANAILAIRAAGKPSGDTDAVGLLERYLVEVDQLVRFVDALDRRKGEQEL